MLALAILTFTTNSQGSDQRELKVVMNARVMRHLHISLSNETTKAKMRAMLERMSTYRPMIEARLKEAGLPPELVVIPAVESMYKIDARSPQEAAGLWQLIPETARHYGLRVDDKIDERLDAEKSTVAALKYLKAIHDHTHDWSLTLLSYNAGDSRVRKLMKKTGVRNAFQLARDGHIRNDESLNYVSRVMAALIVIGHPELVNK